MLRALAGFALVVCSLVSLVPAQGLVVRTMPGYPNAPKLSPQERHPVRPSTEVVVWGNAEIAVGASYTWSFSSNPNVRVIEDADGLSGSIADPAFIAEVVTFELQNGSTKENVDATLVVDDGQGGSGSRTVSIVIIDETDPSSIDELESCWYDTTSSPAAPVKFQCPNVALYTTGDINATLQKSNLRVKCYRDLWSNILH